MTHSLCLKGITLMAKGLYDSPALFNLTKRETTSAKAAQIGAPSSADLAHETGLKIREPDIITPLVDHCWGQLDVMAASIVGAEHDETAFARIAASKVVPSAVLLFTLLPATVRRTRQEGPCATRYEVGWPHMPVRFSHVSLRSAVKASLPPGSGAFGRPGPVTGSGTRAGRPPSPAGVVGNSSRGRS